MATIPRYPLYRRLPEIHRIKDGELPETYRDRDDRPVPAGQLESYVALFEELFGAIRENIESLYHDFFIETCDDWVIPYLGDLLGTSPLSGDPWTLRADVADTIALRRRKGTLGAVELLAFDLTGWAARGVELRENLLWTQHLNHQRPDAGGRPPLGPPGPPRWAAVRGGTVSLRDPAELALLGTPFDAFAHTPDVKAPAFGALRYNLPNLAIFLWRLESYRLPVIKPLAVKVAQAAGADFVVRVQVDPVPPNGLSGPYTRPGNEPAGRPVRLFNSHRLSLFDRRREGTDKLDARALQPLLVPLDQAPGPIPRERLGQGARNGIATGAPEHYLAVETYDPANPALDPVNLGAAGLQLHVPGDEFPGERWPAAGSPWTVRGANLCAWEEGLQPPLADREIAVDPVIGRIAVGLAVEARADALVRDLWLTYSYGAPGPVGAHPVPRGPAPAPWDPASLDAPLLRRVDYRTDPRGLMQALQGIHLETRPVVIEILDSRTHVLDLADGLLAGDTVMEEGVLSLRLNSPLLIRAVDNQRPIIELARPLGFRPENVVGADDAEQSRFDAVMHRLNLRLEGLYLARGQDFPAGAPLIARAALNRLHLSGCTLDPGGFRRFDGSRAPVLPSLNLREPYGFAQAEEEAAFAETPAIVLERCVAGPLAIDAGYTLCLGDSLVDAGQGVDDPVPAPALGNATDPAGGYGPPTAIRGVTLLGRAKVASIDGGGGIFVHALQVENAQTGCLKFSYFSGEAEDSLPPNHGCVRGQGDDSPARLRFTGEAFGDPGYGQLAASSDFRLRERGPGDDAMGAYGFLREAHKWRNLQIRYREFMPVGIRPLLIPVT